MNLTNEVKTIAQAASSRLYKDARALRADIRQVAKAYGVGVGYVTSLVNRELGIK